MQRIEIKRKILNNVFNETFEIEALFLKIDFLLLNCSKQVQSKIPMV